MGIDFSQWPTKAQAAQIIGVSTKTVEKLAEKGKLQQQEVRRIGKPPIVVYHPDDVERVRVERSQPAAPFVIQSSFAEPTQKPVSEPTENAVVPNDFFAGAFSRFLRNESIVTRDIPHMMTISEASQYVRVPVGLLRKMVKLGELKCVSYKRDVWFKKSDLDAL